MIHNLIIIVLVLIAIFIAFKVLEYVVPILLVVILAPICLIQDIWFNIQRLFERLHSKFKK